MFEVDTVFSHETELIEEKEEEEELEELILFLKSS